MKNRLSLLVFLLMLFVVIGCSKPKPTPLDTIQEEIKSEFIKDVTDSNMNFAFMQNQISIKQNEKRIVYGAINNQDDVAHEYELEIKECKSFVENGCENLEVTFQDKFSVKGLEVIIFPVEISVGNSEKSIYRYYLVLTNKGSNEKTEKTVDVEVI